MRKFIQPIIVCAIILTGASGCITVNVNFPETAVKRAADDFVSDLYSAQTASSPTQSPDANAVKLPNIEPDEKKPGEGKKNKVPASDTVKPSTGFIQNFLIPAAFAQSLNANTPKAREIKSRMASRVQDIIKWKSASALGEDFEGNLVLKDSAKVSTADKDKLEKLVQDENADRSELYSELQQANGITDRNQSRIRRFFSAAFRNNSPAGAWVEDEHGWKKK